MGLRELKAMAKSGNYQDIAKQITDLLAWTDSLKKLGVGEEEPFEHGEMKFKIVRLS